MKVIIITYSLIIAGFLMIGCGKNTDVEEQRYTWSTDAPLSIPYRTRIQRYDKTNLVRNHSFETGRTFTLDNATTSFVIDGWQQVGQHVQWVNILKDSLYARDEAYSGYRSVKISRENAYETDEHGDGIMSDFIKVIPGNYQLSFFTRLENVFPLRARLGTRMYDAIEVNLLFYDRNKIQINPRYRFPQINQYINTSFKSLSFANYSNIQSFGWGKIVGKSEHFPFPEGDIPSDAHYVKIFIGLKGRGTMWIDSITFTYTDRNFSIAERMRSYTDTSFTLYEAIIPTPKKYQKMESVVFQTSDFNSEKQPVILIPSDADPVIMKAARIIQETLRTSALGNGDKTGKPATIAIVSDLSSLQKEKSKLVFSLGPTGLFKSIQPVLPQKEIHRHPQGYFIYTSADYPNWVFLGGNNSTGIYYAALTVIQMIDNKQPIYHNARIVDYPDFENRYFAIKNKESGSLLQAGIDEELEKYKFNGAFIIQDSGGNEHFVSADAANSHSLTLQLGESFSVFTMPRFKTPDDSTLTYPYPERYNENETNFLKDKGDLTKYSIPGFPGSLYLIVPPAFNNQLLDFSEYQSKGDQGNKDIKCFYAGCSFYSLNTDDADIERYTGYAGSRPVFMDNSMQISTSGGHYGGNDPYYPGKIRLFNIFEPFGNAEIRQYFSKLDTTLFFINQSASSEIGIIRLATAADFLWNAAAYSKDLSLWKVLQTRYGAETSRDLIRYADKYGLMLEVLLKMRLSEQMTRNLKNGQQLLADLNLLVNEIGKETSANHRLIKELQELNAELKNRMEKLISNPHMLN